MADRYEYDRERGFDRERGRDEELYGRGRQHSREREDERWRQGRHERGMVDRASDEVRSWFGDEEASRRRQRDESREQSERGFGRETQRGYGRDYEPDFTRGYSSGTERGYAAGEDVSRSGGGQGTSRSEWPSPSRDPERSDWSSRSTEGFRNRGRESSWGRDRDVSFAPVSYSYTAWTWSEPGPFTGRGPRGYQRSDDRIREDICDRLTRHGRLDATDIHITVNNGEVTLDGIVDTREAKRMAEDVSESVDGVRDVVNHLKTYRGGSEDRPSQRPGTSTSAGETGTLTGATAVGPTEKKR